MIISQGGIASEEDRPYLMANGFTVCAYSIVLSSIFLIFFPRFQISGSTRRPLFTHSFLSDSIFMSFSSRFNPDRAAAHISKYFNTTSGDEIALQQAVYDNGPVSMGIHLAPSFIFYGSGVYYEPNCPNDFKSLDHVMLVVGWGTDPSGGDYWLVKVGPHTHHITCRSFSDVLCDDIPSPLSLSLSLS